MVEISKRTRGRQQHQKRKETERKTEGMQIIDTNGLAVRKIGRQSDRWTDGQWGTERQKRKTQMKIRGSERSQT